MKGVLPDGQDGSGEQPVLSHSAQLMREARDFCPLTISAPNDNHEHTYCLTGCYQGKMQLCIIRGQQ